MSIALKRRPSPWEMAAPIAYILGAAISFSSASMTLDKGTTPEELISVLTVYIVLGLFLGGIGQLMRAAAHGAVSPVGKRVDGTGKIVGLFGWSLGLVGAVMLAVNGTDAPDWLVPLGVIAVLGVTVVAFLVPLISVGDAPRRR